MGESIGQPDLVEYNIQHALDVIKSTYGVDVSVERKSKDLNKFGRNRLVGTTEATIMTLPAGVTQETYLSTNGITHIASQSAADTQVVRVEGHTISGTDLIFSTQEVTLQGQTKVALPTPIARVTRAYNDNGTELVGPVYIAEDVTFTGGVPQTATAVHAIIPAGFNQTRKASTSISKDDFWIITGMTATCLQKTAAFASIIPESRVIGKSFRPFGQDIGVTSGSGTVFIPFRPYLIIPPNSDVRLEAIADNAGTDVAASIEGYLAIKTQI